MRTGREQGHTVESWGKTERGKAGARPAQGWKPQGYAGGQRAMRGGGGRPATQRAGARPVGGTAGGDSASGTRKKRVDDDMQFLRNGPRVVIRGTRRPEGSGVVLSREQN